MAPQIMNASLALGRQMVVGERSAEVNIDMICIIAEEHEEFSSSPPCVRSRSIIRSQGEFRTCVQMYGETLSETSLTAGMYFS